MTALVGERKRPATFRPSPVRRGIGIRMGLKSCMRRGRSCHVSCSVCEARFGGDSVQVGPLILIRARRLLPLSSPAPRELDGRIASLIGWLRAAPVACPGAIWIAKADDDTYIREDGWVTALHAIGAERQQTGAPVEPRSLSDSRSRNIGIMRHSWERLVSRLCGEGVACAHLGPCPGWCH